MVRQAISELHDSCGSSKTAIQRYIVEHYPLGKNENLINSNVRLTLKRGVERGVLVQANGSGMDGSFKLAERKENKVSSLKDRKMSNVTSEKTKPASFENKGPTSVRKLIVEKWTKTPVPAKHTAKKAKATKSPNAVKGAKPTFALSKSIKKATAVK
ncbi:hypothetical protein KIN20_034378 [Parelaphostrongylus tenuis]|uniref:H15 domain-containing protein n=1 Tax=Parelaphostrongylus tenuis TaxID=148309 RepID=A0AAD5RCI4_PARTN|nr:hypothetical protein KIN20_034378 [Parelaphostrongylus tenuis]